MGLVTCTKCGKVYDYDKYSGICPKCARYNNGKTAAEEHQEFHDKYDGGYNHTEQESHHRYHEVYDTVKNPHEKKKNQNSKKIILILVIVFAINYLIPLLAGFISMIYRFFD